MANKSQSRARKSNSSKNPDMKKIILILTAIIVILLIIAIILISIKGMWGEVVGFVKSLLGENDEGDEPPRGIAELQGNILEMKVLDIGQGDCILLLFPDGQVMVMDIGSEFGTTSPWNVIDKELKDLKISTIDYLFLTHTDYDHVREAKKLADNYKIKNFYLPRADIETSATWKKSYNAALNEKYVDNGVEKQAGVFENVGAYEISGENWTMKCYSFDEKNYPSIKESSSAEDKNAVSPTCLLEYGGRTIVLTGDSNEKSENYLIGKGYFDNVDADVLKVGHHGSKSSTTQDFLNKIDCEYAIISCGEGNSYGHPTIEALNRLDKYVDLIPDEDFNGFAEVYRTDKDGTIIVQIDETGVMNLIAKENEDKNTTTGKPIDASGNTDAPSGVLVIICSHSEINKEMLMLSKEGVYL